MYSKKRFFVSSLFQWKFNENLRKILTTIKPINRRGMGFEWIRRENGALRYINWLKYSNYIRRIMAGIWPILFIDC